MPTSSLPDLAVIGGGGGVLGFLGAVVRGRFTQQARIDRISNSLLERFEDKIKELEIEVAECAKERQEGAVIKLCLRLIVPEMARLQPSNPILRHVGDALRQSFGEVNKDISDLSDLLAQLKEVPGTRYDPEVRRAAD